MRIACLATVLFSGTILAEESKLYKLRFREGAERCAVVRISEEWQYAPRMWPRPLSPGRWEIRKDSTLPAPGYLPRWNGEYGVAPDNYSLNVFRFEWTGRKPEFTPAQPQRWMTATKIPVIVRQDQRVRSDGLGDDAKVVVGGKRFERTGKHWQRSYHDAMLSADDKWLVLQSTDGRIVHRTIFGPGPDRPMGGRAHIDVYHVPTGERKIRLEVNQTEDQGLDSLFTETRIYESRYLFLRVDPRPQRVYFLVCRLTAEP